MPTVILIVRLFFSWLFHSWALAQDDDCRILKFKAAMEGYSLQGHVIKNLTVQRESACDARCFIEHNCVSFNVGSLDEDDAYICELSDSDHEMHPKALVRRHGFTYQPTENACLKSPCHPDLLCQNGFTDKGYRCIRNPQNPQELASSTPSQPESTAPPNEFPSSTLSPPKSSAPTNEFSSSTATPFHESPTSSSSSLTIASSATSYVIGDCSVAPKITGIYSIMNQGLQPFNVYCDQTTDGGGWTMVFKVIGGVASQSFFQLWSSSDTLAENVDAALDTTSTYQGHYKNRIVPNWQTFDPQEARVALYTNGTEVASLKFSATGTDNLNWFSQNNLVQSPWTDLKNTTNLQVFDIHGIVRTFEISGRYAGCENDTGWLLITQPICSWETRLPVPSIVYSKLNNVVSLNQYGDVGVAEVMIVYIR
ncbi:uncharacterized protein LOC144658196 isoform X2 [Oculina patagonica]